MNNSEYYEKVLRKIFPFIEWGSAVDFFTDDTNFYINKLTGCICYYDYNRKILSETFPTIWNNLIKLYEQF